MTTISLGLPEVELDLKDVKNPSFIEEVERGRSGANAGLPSTLRLSTRLHGIQKARYYLIGAHSGIGKTQFIDFFFLISAWLSAKQLGKKIRFIYCSFELSALTKKAKWCAAYLNWKYQLNWSSDFILGRIPEKRPTDEEMKMITEAYTFVEALMKDMVLIDVPLTPEALTDYVVDHYYAPFGTVTRRPVTEEQKKKKRKGDLAGFKATQEIPLTLLFIDHLALLAGRDTKKAMDDMSTQLVLMRNLFQLSPVVVQQFNQDLNKSRREAITRHGIAKAPVILAPQQQDFGDSTYTYRDADIVLGLVKPNRFEVAEFAGFPACPPGFGGLGDNLVILYQIKNRYGQMNMVMYPLFMNGIAGMFYDLPNSLDPDVEPWIELAQNLVQYG